MDRQKEIEETKKSCTDCLHYEICSLWTTTDLDEDEAYKYCYGHYRPRIPKDSVLITREEYESMQKLFTYDKPMLDRIYIFIKEIKGQAHKETVREVLNLILSNISEIKYDGVCEKLVYIEDIIKIAKQFGVEVEQWLSK